MKTQQFFQYFTNKGARILYLRLLAESMFEELGFQLGIPENPDSDSLAYLDGEYNPYVFLMDAADETLGFSFPIYSRRFDESFDPGANDDDDDVIYATLTITDTDQIPKLIKCLNNIGLWGAE